MMPFYIRGIKYLTRQKAKSAILSGIFMLAITVGIFGQSVIVTTEKQIDEISETTNVSIHITAGDFITNELSHGLYRNLSELENISSINRHNRTSATWNEEDFTLASYDDFLRDGPFYWGEIQLASDHLSLNPMQT